MTQPVKYHIFSNRDPPFESVEKVEVSGSLRKNGGARKHDSIKLKSIIHDLILCG